MHDDPDHSRPRYTEGVRVMYPLALIYMYVFFKIWGTDYWNRGWQ
jgi:hypothetical protein